MTDTNALNGETSDRTPRRAMARFTGLLYLSLAVLGPFSMLYVPSQMLVPNDAAATVANVLARQGLFRAGLAVDTLIFLIEIVLTVLLYRLFEPVNRTLSMMAAASRLAMTVIQGMNLALHLTALRLAAGSQHELVLVLLNAHADVVLIWQAFFGLHLAFLGYLVYRSGYIPRVLGGLLMLASAGYLSDSLGRFLSPSYGDHMGWFVGLTASVGEVAFTVWLLAKGVRRLAPVEPEPKAGRIADAPAHPAAS